MSDTKHQGAPGRGGSDPDHPVDRGVAGSGHERVDENRPRRTGSEAGGDGGVAHLTGRVGSTVSPATSAAVAPFTEPSCKATV